VYQDPDQNSGAGGTGGDPLWVHTGEWAGGFGRGAADFGFPVAFFLAFMHRDSLRDLVLWRRFVAALLVLDIYVEFVGGHLHIAVEIGDDILRPLVDNGDYLEAIHADFVAPRSPYRDDAVIQFESVRLKLADGFGREENGCAIENEVACGSGLGLDDVAGENCRRVAGLVTVDPDLALRMEYGGYGLVRYVLAEK